MQSFALAFAIVSTTLTLAHPASADNPVVVLETSKGNIEVEVDAKNAPISAKNFLRYVDDKYYDGTVFHRVIKGFMIQGGGFDQRYQKKPTRAPIKNEAANGLSNKRGTVAMARTAVVDSATAQFFINVVDNRFLDHRPGAGPRGYGYAVFGKVIKGMDVVDKIRNTPTGACPGLSRDCPQEPMVIKRAYRKGPAAKPTVPAKKAP